MPEVSSDVIRILVIDDHVILREGVVSLIQAQPDFRVVGEAGSVAEATAKAEKLAPDLILMDYTLPDGTGLDATEAILKIQPDAKVVFLTVRDSDDALFSAIRIGAKGYLPKNISAAEMVSRLRGLARGKMALTEDLNSRVLSEFARTPSPISNDGFEELTPRELEILRELSHGATNREIADKMVISVNTVKNHVHQILQKLEVKNRRQAAKVAAERELN
jgi:DNA-binding NarL/FixJ family response regulator